MGMMEALGDHERKQREGNSADAPANCIENGVCRQKIEADMIDRHRDEGDNLQSFSAHSAPLLKKIGIVFLRQPV